MLSVGHTVTTSVGMCDIDIRPVRYSVLCNLDLMGSKYLSLLKLKKKYTQLCTVEHFEFFGK